MFFYIHLMCLLWFVKGKNILKHVKGIKKFKRVFIALSKPNNKKEGIMLKLLLPQWFIYDWYCKIINESIKDNNDEILFDMADIVWYAMNERSKKTFISKNIHN